MARIIDSDFLHRALQHFYGYSSFRTGQEEIISEILHGQPVLAVLPTGAGKSICFQLPSLLLKGVTLVISPLISLMKDQAEALTARGIPAAYLDSSMSSNEYGRVLHAALNKQCKFLYVAPERLVNQQFIDFARQAYITMVAVDEAHCVSQWGHSFRKEYYNIPDFIQALPTKPLVAAFTATATPDVRRDIIKRLGIPEAKIVVTGFDRPNLHFAVQRTQDKERSLLEFMRKHKKDCGVVYCATRNKVESVTQLLRRQGFSAWQPMPSVWALISRMYALWCIIICPRISKATIRRQDVQGVTACLRNVCCFTIRRILRSIPILSGTTSRI